MNPYAAPRARLEHDALAGTPWRTGKLVRIGRETELPDRCVVCSAPANGYRVKRRLYWAPAAWTWTAPFVPVVVFVAATFLANRALMLLVWPTAIVLYVTHLFVRKPFRLAVGLCPRHRTIRRALLAMSVICIAVMVLALREWHPDYGWIAGTGSRFREALPEHPG